MPKHHYFENCRKLDTWKGAGARRLNRLKRYAADSRLSGIGRPSL